MKKQLISWILIVLMLVTMVPISALASEAETTEIETVAEEPGQLEESEVPELLDSSEEESSPSASEEPEPAEEPAEEPTEESAEEPTEEPAEEPAEEPETSETQSEAPVLLESISAEEPVSSEENPSEESGISEENTEEPAEESNSLRNGWEKNGSTWLYYVNDVTQTGWLELEGNLYYLDPTTGCAAVGWKKISGVYYYFDKTTRAALVGLQYVNSKLHYFDETGAEQYGLQEVEGNKYYFDSNGYAVTGWKKVDGVYYYFASGTYQAVTGLKTISGYIHYFDEQGVEQYGFYTIEGDKYYFNTNGVAISGWKKIDGKYYYFGATTRKALTGLVFINSSLHYFDDEGVEQYGLFIIEGKKYFFNTSGAAATGWKKMDGNYYYFSSSTGEALTGLQTINGYLHYFDDEGVEQYGLHVVNGNKYFFNANGVAVSGWKKIDGQYHYFSSYTNKGLTGLQYVNGYLHYFDEDGVEQYGLLEVEGNTYFFNDNGVAVSGWKLLEGSYYFFSSSTYKALKGLQTVNGYLHYFDPSGVEQYGLVEIGGSKYFFNANGAAASGWKTIEGETYYFSASTNKALTGGNTISGKIYYFDGNGVLQSAAGDITAADGSQYRIGADGYLVTGWVEDTEGNRYYYGTTDGKLVTGMGTIGGYKYLFDDNGVLQSEPGDYVFAGAHYRIGADGYVVTGWIDDANGNRYYYSTSTGKRVSGFQSIGSYYYYFDPDSDILQTNGLITTPEGTLYCANANGALRYGWYTDSNGDQYYFGYSKRAALTGKWELDSTNYFFDEVTGVLATNGWAEGSVSGKRYYAKASGALRTGWFKDTDGTYYYFGYSSCAALTGFWDIDDEYYFFDETTGALLVSQWVESASGDSYYANASGILKTGWYKTTDATYYFDGRCKMVTGWRRVNGVTYYFSTGTDGYGNKGELVCNTTVDNVPLDANGKATLTAKESMILVAQQFESPTNYLMLTDTYACRVGVFTGSAGNWNLLYYWSCTAGKEGHETPTGQYALYEHDYSFGNGTYVAYYGSAFHEVSDGRQWLFHSILYQADGVSIRNANLGYNASAGCVRLATSNAKWVYYNVPLTTVVYNY